MKGNEKLIGVLNDLLADSTNPIPRGDSRCLQAQPYENRNGCA